MTHQQTILAIDSDKHAAATYAENFPDVPVRCATVADVLPELTKGMASIICAGFPCQPHSLAGKRLASADERDGGDDFVAAIRKVKPRHFLGENVPGLLTSENGKYWQRLYASMEAAGYQIEFRCLNAVNFGVPQFRNRLWVWGIRQDVYESGVRWRWPHRTHGEPCETGNMFGGGLRPWVTVGQALGIKCAIHQQYGAGMVRRYGDRRWWADSEPSQTVRAITGKTAQAYEYRWSDAMLAKHPPAQPAQTKWYKGGAEGLVICQVDDDLRNLKSADGIAVRRLTPWECARLQSAPDYFRWPEKISKTQMYRIIGNGWASKMGYVFGQAFAAADPKSRTMIDLFCGGGLGAVGWHGKFWSYENEH